MNTLIKDFLPTTYARISGLLYLLIAIAGGFSIGYMPSVIMAPGDAATTAQNIMDNNALLRFGIIADIAVFLMELVLTVMLYQLFKSINKTLSMVALFSRLGMGIVMALNLFNLLIPMLLLSDASYLSAFDTNQLQSLSFVFLEVHQYGIYIWGIFFSLHLVALGYLVIKSGYFPKTLGMLMLVGSFGYLFESLAAFSLPANELLSIVINTFLGIAVIGELSFTFWLLIKGIKMEKWPS